jgi:oxygen-independent coproporphyrinogen-3 oxidase
VGVRDSTVGVYVHVPFCQRVCPYCDFAVVAARSLTAAAESRYVDALLRELEARRPAFAGRSLASLYFGGGTPSLLRPAAIARIAAAVREAFAPGAEPPEVTLEVNPSTLERERLPGFRDAGVGRISLGIQSFDDAVLRRLGRAHRAEAGRRTLRACREVGFASVSIDLIFGAPGQTPTDFRRDLAEVVAFAPEHVSTYELTIEPGTPFATAAARGQLRIPADPDVRDRRALAMLEDAEATLGAAGWIRYELSNYARPGFESVHNRRYWERRPVLGLGVGAFSTDPPAPHAPFGVRRANRRELGAYLEAVAAGRSPEAAPGEVLDARTSRGEALFLALRTARGLDAARFAEEFGAPPRRFHGEAIDDLLAAGLLAESATAGDLCLTPQGRLLSDTVFERFV